MKKKVLTKQIVLALAMTGLFPMGQAWAADLTFKDFVGTTEKGGTITVTEDTIVNSKYAGASGYLEAQEIIGDYKIELAQDKTLTLNNLNMYYTNITGINGEYGGDININIDKAYSDSGANTSGLVAGKAENAITTIKANDLTITNTTNTIFNNISSGIFIENASHGNMNIELQGKLMIQANLYGISSERGADDNLTTTDFTVKANDISINGEAAGIVVNGDCTFNITAKNKMEISGIHSNLENDSELNLTAGNNVITADKESSLSDAIHNYDGKIYLTSTAGDNKIDGAEQKNGIRTDTASDGVTVNAARDNIIGAGQNGVYSQVGTISLSAKRNNQIQVGKDGLKADGQDSAQSVVTSEAGVANLIEAGDTETVNYNGQEVTFGDSHAAYAKNGGDIFIKAGEANILSGAVYANGTGAVVKMSGLDGAEANVTNAVYSAAVISNAGDLNTDDNFKDKSVISALYAEDGAKISVSGTQNVFRTYADNTNENQLERVLWAYNGADIDVDGETFISTDRYSSSPNSADIAIAAGTAVGLDEATVNAPVTDRATVTLNYDGNSSITGDILAAYAGQVDIAAKEGSGAGISVTGNILSGNNGVLNLDLGQGGVLTGRADDYGDAGANIDGNKHGAGEENGGFFNPAFSSEILTGGAVNLTMSEGSVWNVTGQSWITSIDTGSSHAVIDLVSANQDRNANASALTIYNMNGNATFKLHLDGDRSTSDMIYMKHANGEYLINVADAVSDEDINGSGFNGLRFATVGTGSNVKFSAVTFGQGVNNIIYTVGSDKYSENSENNAYNSTGADGVGNTMKPGTGLVDEFFKNNEVPPETNAVDSQNVVLLAENDGTNEGQTSSGGNVEETTNFKLTGRTEQVSNAGQTVLSMSKVNYSNAVYMDRLNKRMGEARYIEGDDGLWVRLRHDRIGKDDAFRSMNTMFELGYDWHAKGQKDGEHRQGVAFDYMRGTADYKNVAGDGDVRRAGVWLYDTWMGDKGHYSDYVVKYGRLSNDFDIYSELGEKISGDYDNDVWSVSAEYGRKKDIGNDWYFEPQAQMQYAYVTSADYTTSQGTKVELDGIDSLLGRAGFRLGRDTSEGNTVYFKADILHEFLGDQSIRAMDATGTLSTTYENEGTWYDVGFGFAHRMGKDSYVFLDVEHSFGNDNDDTYQINIGLNHAF